MCKSLLYLCIKHKTGRFSAVSHKKTACFSLFGFLFCELFRFSLHLAIVADFFDCSHRNCQKSDARSRHNQINERKAEANLNVIFFHCVPTVCRRTLNILYSRFCHFNFSHIHLGFLPFGFFRKKISAGKNILCRRIIFMLLFRARFFHQNENSAKCKNGGGTYQRHYRNDEKF